MISSAFIKTDQIDISHSQAEHTQRHPEKLIGNDHKNNKINEPKSNHS